MDSFKGVRKEEIENELKRLECEKRAIEVAKLDAERRGVEAKWWTRPNYWVAIIPGFVGLITLIQVLWTGNWESKREILELETTRLEGDKKTLEGEKKTLEATKETLEGEKKKLESEIFSLRGEIMKEQAYREALEKLSDHLYLSIEPEIDGEIFSHVLHVKLKAGTRSRFERAKTVPSEMLTDQLLEHLSRVRVHKIMGEGLSDKAIEKFADWEAKLTQVGEFRGWEIKEIDLSGSEVSDNGVRYLTSFDQLTSLVLSEGITDKGLAGLKGANSLETLYLYPNQITEVGVGHLKDLPALKKLDLGYTTLNDEQAKKIGGLPNLTNLDLGPSGISDQTLEVIGKNLPNLTYLDIHDTNVTDEGLSALQKLPLEVIILRNTRDITDKGLVAFEGMDSLERVTLDGCPKITDDGRWYLTSLRILVR